MCGIIGSYAKHVIANLVEHLDKTNKSIEHRGLGFFVYYIEDSECYTVAHFDK